MIPSRRSATSSSAAYSPQGESAEAADSEDESSDDDDTTDGPPSEERLPPPKKAKGGGGVLTSKDIDEARREEIRLEKNRIKARNARRRKKIMIEDLEKRIKEVSDENHSLKEENAGLRTRLIAAEGRDHSHQHETMQAMPSIPYRLVGGIGEVPLPIEQVRALAGVGATTSYGHHQHHENELEFDRYRTLTRSLPFDAGMLPPGVSGGLEITSMLRELSHRSPGGQGIYRDAEETPPMLHNSLLAVRLRQAQAEDSLRAVSERYDDISSQLSSSQQIGLPPSLPGQVAFPSVSYSQDQTHRASRARVSRNPHNGDSDVVDGPTRTLRENPGMDMARDYHRRT